MAAPITSAPRWVTIAEAADALSVSIKTIRRRIADGSLDARRIGPRLIRVNLASLELVGEPVAWAGGRR